MSTVSFSLNTGDNSGGYSCAGVSNARVEKGNTRVKQEQEQELNELFASAKYKNMTHQEKTMIIVSTLRKFS